MVVPLRCKPEAHLVVKLRLKVRKEVNSILLSEQYCLDNINVHQLCRKTSSSVLSPLRQLS